MNLLRKINWLCTAILCVVLAAGCSDDEVVSSSNSGTGYIKLRLVPQAATRAARLDDMTDAKKVEIVLLYGDKPITQSLNLSSVANAADIALETEKLELRAGEYKLMSYTLFSDVKPGAEQPERLMTIYPDEDILFRVNGAHITELSLDVKATIRGQVYFDLIKDLSNFGEWSDKAQADTRTISRDESMFSYADVEEVDLYYRRKGTSEHATPHAFKVYSKKGEKYLHTDTVKWEVGEYEITRYMLYTKKRTELLLVNDLEDVYVTVTPNVCLKSSFDVKFPANMSSLKDYMALYMIWVNTGGPTEWGYNGQNYPAKANWRFKDRPVDEWGNQPGVELDGRGRVKLLDLGSFNPVGAIPQELGHLTELETLWLGTHNDIGTIEDESGIVESYSLSSLDLHYQGVDLRNNRMKIWKERLKLNHPKPSSRIYNVKKEAFKYAKPATYDLVPGSLTNRITEIPESIKNLRRLAYLFVANGRVTDLPDGLVELPMLTDVEFYNCPFKKFPEALKKMKNVISLNFSCNPTIPSDNLVEGLNEFLLSSKETLQILYVTNCGLTEFPQNMRETKKIGLLDMAFNKLRELPSLNRSIAPVQAIFDNNKITDVADDFCDTDDIETFSVANNLITEFPNLFGNGLGASTNYRASTVDFSSNRITHFKEGFLGINAETLTLSMNQFGNRKGGTEKKRRTFPRDLSDTNSKINFLEIANCEIDSLPAYAFRNLKSLQALDASGNSLRYIPTDFNVEKLPYISGLDLSRNCFALFPLEVLNVHNLNKLYLSDQAEYEYDAQGNIVSDYRCMTVFPSGLYKHNGLKVLDVSNNDIRKIIENDFPFTLAAFNIAGNSNITMTIPSSVCTSIANGSFSFGFDSNQNIQGCPILDLDIYK